MGMVAPQGVVYLGTVPWNHNYKHVFYDRIGDAAYIISQFCPYSTDGYTYLRESTDIRVPYNADDIYGVNYCIYMNNNKWFFAFVNTITYVNNSTSLLHLEEDIWQTWGADLDWHACFVAREHVNSDDIGEHLINEPAFPFEVETTEQSFIDYSTDSVIIIMTNAVPHIKDGTSMFIAQQDDNIDGSDPVSGKGKYAGLYQGAKPYAFTNPVTAGHFLDNLNKAGAAESVCAVFLFPEDYLDFDDNTHEVTPFNFPKKSQRRYVAPKVCGGSYVPRNNKLLTFPYSFTTLRGMNGTELTIQYEKNRNDDDGFQIDIEQVVPFDPSASAFISVPLYDGHEDGTTDINGEYMLSTSCAPQVSWVYGAFQNWYAQNKDMLNYQLNKWKWDAELTAMGGTAGMAAAATLLAGAPITLAIGGALVAAEALAMLNEKVKEKGQQAEIASQKKIPNHVMSASTDNNLFAMNHEGFLIRSKSIMADYARSLDDFFDQFGYEVDRIKVPNRTGRPSWNYVKTVAANIGGDIPADRLAAINTTLDNGITFWHTTDVGNYSLSNAIVIGG